MSRSDYKNLRQGYLDNTGYNKRFNSLEKYSNAVEKFTMFTNDHELYQIGSQIKVVAKYTKDDKANYILLDATINNINTNNTFKIEVSMPEYDRNFDYYIGDDQSSIKDWYSRYPADRLKNVSYKYIFLPNNNGYYFALEIVGGKLRDPITGADWPIKQYKNVPDNNILIQKLNSGMSECETLRIYVSNSYINPHTNVDKIIDGTYYVNILPAMRNPPEKITFNGKQYPLINGNYIEYRKTQPVNCTGTYGEKIYKTDKIDTTTGLGYYEQTFNISQNKSCGGKDCPLPKITAPTSDDCPGTYTNIQTSLSDCKVVGISKKGVVPTKQGTKTTVEKSYLGDTLCPQKTSFKNNEPCPSTA